MSRSLPPPPPNFAPEQLPLARNSRYQRPRRAVVWWALLLGLLVGIGGGVFFAWVIAPVQETETLPRQLNAVAKADYVVAVALRFGYDSDLSRAVDALIALRLGNDPFQGVADIACQLASTGYVDSTAGIRALRSLQIFYRLQGKAGCADALVDDATPIAVLTVVVATSTPTLAPPPPTKTATPSSGTPAPIVEIVPTTRPRQQYVGDIVTTFCSARQSGTIEVFVQDYDGQGIPGQVIRVRWDGGTDDFVTGLKPERDTGYADFTMEAGFNYTIDMPAQSDPLAQPIIAETCLTSDGAEALKSYRVIFSLQ